MSASLSLPTLVLLACQGWDPRAPFERDSPEVQAASEAYDAGDARAAAALLADYLGTGACKDGQIAAPPSLSGRREGTFDLGLALFGVAEAFGARFQEGKAVQEQGRPAQGDAKARSETIACALAILKVVLDSPGAGTSLRARAHYLEGNLHFLKGEYAEAVKSYERALLLVPGEGDAGDPVGRDAAWNRAVALRRIEDQKDAGGPDGGSSDGGGGEGGSDASGGGNNNEDGGKDSGSDKSKDGGADSGKDKDDPKDKQDKKDKDKAGKNKDGGGNQAEPQPPQSQDPNEQNKDEEDGGGASQQPAQPSEQQGQQGQQSQSASPAERVLDSLERAPMLQHELARRHANQRKVRGSADK